MWVRQVGCIAYSGYDREQEWKGQERERLSIVVDILLYCIMGKFLMLINTLIQRHL